MATAPAFPGYNVVGLLGQGGMGQVFLAEDESLGRRVAIKTILPEVAGGGEGRARFLREARAMATVEHPRVVRVYSFGETEGQAFFVMELIEGETLAERLSREGRLSVGEALRIAREVTEALAAAWARGIVHRDVKPSNVILDRDGHAHVADFGLARSVQTEVDASGSITLSGAFVGSPHYLAPEQARCQPVDFRTDIYSLGIVLFEMLTGRRPFEGQGLEVIARRLSERLPALAELAPHVPERLATLVHHMAEREPVARPDSYSSLLAELSELALIASRPAAATSSLPARRVPAPVSARSPSRAARWLALGIAGIAALAGVVWLSGDFWRERFSVGPRPPGALVVAVAPFHGRDAVAAEEARALHALIESELQRLLGDEEGRALGVTVAPGSARSQRDARRLAERSGADWILWGEVIAFRGEVEIQPGLTPAAGGVSQQRLPSIPLEGDGSPLEVRRRAAAQIAEAVVQAAARTALDQGRAADALALLRECAPTPETLELRAEALERLGRAGEAGKLREEAGSSGG